MIEETKRKKSKSGSELTSCQFFPQSRFFFFFFSTRLKPGFVHIHTVIYILYSFNVSGYVQAIQIKSRLMARFYKLCRGSSWLGSLPVSRLLPPQSAHTGGCSASLAIVDGLNEFHRRGELHPPIALLPTQPAGIEIIDVLNGGQQAGRVCPYEDKDKHRDKVIRSRD